MGTLRCPPKRVNSSTRREVEFGWLAVSDLLRQGGRRDLAVDAKRFIEEMPTPTTDKESMAERLAAQLRDARERDRPISR